MYLVNYTDRNRALRQTEKHVFVSLSSKGLK